MTFYKYTNIGPRNQNEDSLFVDIINQTVFAFIADGVGGLPGGKEASSYAVEKFRENLVSKHKLSFADLLQKVNNDLIEIASTKLNVKSIATTFTGLYANQKKIKGVHVGDSKAILIRSGEIVQVTKDDSELGRLVREKKIDLKDADTYPRKNILENAIGFRKELPFQSFEFPSKKGDRVLVSTDGFHETVNDDTILKVSNKYRSLENVYLSLIRETENRILSDNTSFILLEIPW